MTKPTAIDIFCGAGGLSEGFRQAGYHVVVGNDIDHSSALTFKATHPEATFLEGSIDQFSVADFLKAGNLKRGDLDVLIGGPPCQGYSVYNHRRGMADERSSLYLEYLRLVSGLNPKWIVLENVTGISSVDGGYAVDAILNGFRDLGYHAEANVLKAEEYGIPQERRRMVFVGNRINAPILWPTKTHGPGLEPYVTVKDAIGDLPILMNGETYPIQEHTSYPMSKYQELIRKGSNKVINHSAPKLGQINLDRLKFIPQGGSWRDIPYELLPAGMKKAKRSDHTKRYGRLSWNGLSSTILTKCDIHWGAYIHPSQERSISVREAARFQSFPDWFEFHGSKTEQYVQIGNAVPPILGKVIAKSITKATTLAEDEKLSIAV